MEKHFHSDCPSNNKRKSKVQDRYFGEGWCFSEAFQEQIKNLEKIKEQEDFVSVLSGVHKHTFTLGNSLKTKEPLPQDFIQTDRGGRIMYHGPGQLTLYPVFKLKRYFSGPRDYTKFLFDLCIDYFKTNYGLDLMCKNNGLWNKEDKKVGFVGLRIKDGVVYHGLSLNYSVGLEAFLEHSPCDISGDQAGNLFAQKPPNLKEEALRLTKALLARLTLKKGPLR